MKDCPGELVHVDIKKLGRVPDCGGWKLNGRPARDQTQKVGYEFCHSMVDDHSRVAYTEVLGRDDAEAAAGFMLRAAEWFAGLSYRIDRVMTDNAFLYTRSRQFGTVLDTIGADHKRIRPHRSQTNGKVCDSTRFSPKDGLTNDPMKPTSSAGTPSPTSSTRTIRPDPTAN